MTDVGLYDLLDICKAYARLGWAVQEQLDDCLQDSSPSGLDDLNDNALDMIRGFLDTVEELGICEEAQGLNEELEAYLAGQRIG